MLESNPSLVYLIRIRIASRKIYIILPQMISNTNVFSFSYFVANTEKSNPAKNEKYSRKIYGKNEKEETRFYRIE